MPRGELPGVGLKGVSAIRRRDIDGGGDLSRFALGDLGEEPGVLGGTVEQVFSPGGPISEQVRIEPQPPEDVGARLANSPRQVRDRERAVGGRPQEGGESVDRPLVGGERA
jgi:hypothetical protein